MKTLMLRTAVITGAGATRDTMSRLEKKGKLGLSSAQKEIAAFDLKESWVLLDQALFRFRRNFPRIVRAKPTSTSRAGVLEL